MNSALLEVDMSTEGVRKMNTNKCFAGHLFGDFEEVKKCDMKSSANEKPTWTLLNLRKICKRNRGINSLLEPM